MKFRGTWLPLVAALALPGALRAQEDECPCPGRPGMIGVMFGAEEDDVDGVRIIEVRRGSPAERAGLREGDVVIRLDGEDADESMEGLPTRLQAGDSVRLRIVRDGDEREVVVVAAPRPGARFGFINPGAGENLVIINGDSLRVPLDALTFRIDSLRTQLHELDGGRLRVEVDSLARMFTDSAGVWTQRMPEVRFHMREPLAEGLREDIIIQGDALPFAEGRPFFMELGRRSAAGAELAEMNEGLSRYFNGQRRGALVIEVSPESPAARAGLEAGDVIVRAGGQEVGGPEDVREALNEAEAGRVSLEVIRQGRRRELSLEWTGDRIIQREFRTAPRVRGRVEVRPREN